jgi:hypothetical protein
MPLHCSWDLWQNANLRTDFDVGTFVSRSLRSLTTAHENCKYDDRDKQFWISADLDLSFSSKGSTRWCDHFTLVMEILTLAFGGVVADVRTHTPECPKGPESFKACYTGDPNTWDVLGRQSHFKSKIQEIKACNTIWLSYQGLELKWRWAQCTRWLKPLQC